MVSIRDRALVEARAKGLDIEASLKHPFRQLLKLDIVVSAIGIAVMLLVYYTAVAFGTIYFETICGLTAPAGVLRVRLSQTTGFRNGTREGAR